MNYDKDIPDFAMLPAKEVGEFGLENVEDADLLAADAPEEEFDPSPYEALLNMQMTDAGTDTEVKAEAVAESVMTTAPADVAMTLAEAKADAFAEPVMAKADAYAEANPEAYTDAAPTTDTTTTTDTPATAPAHAEYPDDEATKVDLSMLVLASERKADTDTPAETDTDSEPVLAYTPANTDADTNVPTESVLADAQTETPANTPANTDADTEIALANANPAANPDTDTPAGADAQPVSGIITIPDAQSVITSDLKMTDIREKEEKHVYIEEDILVPDTKEDLASILSMTGVVKLHNWEVRADKTTEGTLPVAGEIELHTLYLPEKYQGEHHIIDIKSRVPFKNDWHIDSVPGSRLVICPHIESINYTVVNERKFRAKIELKLALREYANVEMRVFQGLNDEKLQLRKEKIQITHVSERKSHVTKIDEVLRIKETQPRPERILKYDLNIVENHKQVSEDKAVVNGTIYCNILYLGHMGEEPELTPQLYQNKVEFTQFIPIQNSSDGSRVTFKNGDLSVRIKELAQSDEMADEDEDYKGGSSRGDGNHRENEVTARAEDAELVFALEGNIETALELYKNLEKEIVTDVYHIKKDIVCDKVQLESMSLGGSGMTEASVREIINVPEVYGDVKKVIFMDGNVKACKSRFEQNKNYVEGIMDISLLCLPEDPQGRAFRLNKEIPFKGTMEIPAGKANNKASSQVSVKELWFDKINARQIEVNANLCIHASVYCQEKYHVIQKVCFLDPACDKGNQPGMVVYIVKPGDSLWQIAKTYRTTVDMIMEINGLEEGQPLYPGQKLLIVK